MTRLKTAKIEILDKDKLFRFAADMFTSTANTAVASNDKFTAALSGGSTPKALYSLLADKYSNSIQWEKTHIFFSDERCVPPDSPESNFRMANDTLLSKVDIPPENIHRMKGEKEPGEAAAEYTEELRNFFGPGIPKFDLILLGMGEDGHTASIFPGSEAVDEVFTPVVSKYVPKLDSHRLTLTPPVLLRAKRIVFLITGQEKAHALHMVMEESYQPDAYPAQILLTADGEVIWLVDLEAASQLKAV